MGSRRYSLLFALSTALVVTSCDGVPEPLAPEGDVTVAPDFARAGGQSVDIIVVLNSDFAPGGHAANQAAAAQIARGLGMAPGLTFGTALFGFSASVPSGRLNGLDRNPRVAYWELDQVASIPAPRQAAPKRCRDNNTGPGCKPEPDPDEDTTTPSEDTQVTPWGIARVGGAGDGTRTAAVAWIIDTGVDFNHGDLNVDVEQSANFVTRGKNSATDGNGHGTHVAGTIAAIDNAQDVIGVAAGATVVSVRVLDNSGRGFYSWVIAGIDHVAANGKSGDVANMSLTGGASQALDDAVANAATLVKFALAAGNSGADANGFSPARVNDTNVYTVSAIDSNDRFASFSNWGNPPIDFAAPGVGVLSLARGGGTITFSGTSMAAPHVAGLLLLGEVNSDGTVTGDPDLYPDLIAYR